MISPLRLHQKGETSQGEVVLYWMTATRRLHDNFALEYALHQCDSLGLPLLIAEGLSARYPWANQRFDRFIAEGMHDNAQAAQALGLCYWAYIEPEPGDGPDWLQGLVEHSALVVTDAFPTREHRALLKAAQSRVQRRFAIVDSAGLFPVSAADRPMPTAHSFRRWMHRRIYEDMPDLPAASPSIPSVATGIQAEALLKKWQPRFPSAGVLEKPRPHTPAHGPSSLELKGGTGAARARLSRFLSRLDEYTERNQPSDDKASGLSPYLHFGHISTHQVLREIWHAEGWDQTRCQPQHTGKRAGFWGLSEAAESFLDELITWRELGYGFCHFVENYHQLDGLPEWAQKTIHEHRSDPRSHLYSLEALEAAETHDPIWNAAQRQLVVEGKIHNYLRMLWGKLIYAWSETPEQALETLITLNNRYALDGRDPNSYSGIMWTLGRFDRAWGPERPVFGKLRYMTSQSTQRKYRLAPYLDRFDAQSLATRNP